MPSRNAAGGNSITSSCEHPEVALQLFDTINANEELFRLLAHGIEGDHYTVESDGRATMEAATYNPSSSDRYGIWTWTMGNYFQGYERSNQMVGALQLGDTLTKACTKVSPVFGFLPDTLPVESEFAQIQALRTEYESVLLSGASEDWEATYEEYLAKLDAAGLDKVLTELQAQVDRHVGK